MTGRQNIRRGACRSQARAERRRGRCIVWFGCFEMAACKVSAHIEAQRNLIRRLSANWCSLLSSDCDFVVMQCTVSMLRAPTRSLEAFKSISNWENAWPRSSRLLIPWQHCDTIPGTLCHTWVGYVSTWKLIQKACEELIYTSAWHDVLLEQTMQRGVQQTHTNILCRR